MWISGQRAAGYCAAHSGWAEAASGPGWLAVGDAALACDPLSSQGLLNALYSGLMAASALRRALAGDTDALKDYQRIIAQVVDAYRAHLAAWYSLESRWPDLPFWARRRDAGWVVTTAGEPSGRVDNAEGYSYC